MNTVHCKNAEIYGEKKKDRRKSFSSAEQFVTMNRTSVCAWKAEKKIPARKSTCEEKRNVV